MMAKKRYIPETIIRKLREAGILQQMYGQANYQRMQQRFPDEIRKQVRDLAEEFAQPEAP